MFGLTRARQSEREEKDTGVFGIRASTGEPQQMGYTKDSLSYFTTHSSHCLFTNWYVRNLCLCAVCFFSVSFPPRISICIFCMFWSCLSVHDHVNVGHLCTCPYVCLRPCMCWLPHASPAASPGPQRTICLSVRLNWILSVFSRIPSFLMQKTRSY